MANKSFYSYQEPIEKFEKISGKVIMKFDLEVIGLYCKMVMLSRGKVLSMDFLSKKIKVSVKKLRRIIVFLEGEGYITRVALKSPDGKFAGWHYKLWAEAVSDKKKTHAGKADLTDDGLTQNRTSPQTDKSENGKENIISTDNSIYNDTDNNCTINSPVYKEETDNGSAEPAHAPSDEDVFVEKMKKRFPRIMKMEQPLTLKQAKDVKDRFGSDLVQKILNEMENWKKLLKNNVSAYMTIIAWCEKEQERL